MFGSPTKPIGAPTIYVLSKIFGITLALKSPKLKN
jgi:hypothetical protein